MSDIVQKYNKNTHIPFIDEERLDMNAKFKKILKSKTTSMYEDNMLSKAEIDDLEIFNKIFYKSYNTNPKSMTFRQFEKNEIDKSNDIIKKRKDEYKNNEYAKIVCSYLFKLSK